MGIISVSRKDRFPLQVAENGTSTNRPFGFFYSEKFGVKWLMY